MSKKTSVLQHRASTQGKIQAQGSQYVLLEERLEQLSESSFSGPIPPPDVLSEYREIDSSFPERCMKMAEKEQEHRHAMEREITELEKKKLEMAQDFVPREQNLKSRGQSFAFILATTAFGMIAFSVWMKDSTTAGILAGTTITALAAIFVTGRIVEIRNGKNEEKLGT